MVNCMRGRGVHPNLTKSHRGGGEDPNLKKNTPLVINGRKSPRRRKSIRQLHVVYHVDPSTGRNTFDVRFINLFTKIRRAAKTA